MHQFVRIGFLVVMLGTAAVASAASQLLEQPESDRSTSEPVMLILRGIANSENPRGQLDDGAALQYAWYAGFRGEVLDVAGNTGPDSPQVRMALDRIRDDQSIVAIYGFSGGGYNARHVWAGLTATQRERIRRVIVVGSPGVAASDFPGMPDVIIKRDPPAGHMAGPKVLLQGEVGPQAPLELGE
jgi:hypothetical protein